MNEFEAVLDEINAGNFPKAQLLMEEIIQEEQAAIMEDDENIYLSLNHVIEYYVYQYYFKPVKEVKMTEKRYNEYYRTYGNILFHEEEYVAALDAYNTAIKWNPVDLDSYLGLAELHKYAGNLEDYLKVTQEVYKYCCTRATMARYYRNIAFYYVETYKPDIAMALYSYSNIYYKTENADNELSFLSKAINKEVPNYALKDLQDILSQNNIQLGPDSTTIGIVYRVGQILLEDGDKLRAKDCFTIVYDITQDKEVEDILNEL